ncbi:MAG: D-aminoacyl-tRNA deacylase [Sutterellaceae bacterium]|nr:D-aminoacyl-tRNA deacylase [Burkholderiaceae bacterium]MCX7902608.1 D-aminoacyl-tRNA deacylase [Burkholderiaceae bacterium]MDW8430767.1 D-aminoacyl-tRNA deacylase [Sutterellaceae bacterium]
MIGLLQRVTRAEVRVEGRTVGAIGTGLLALVCAERGDGERQAEALLAKILALRVFADAQGRMNRSLRDIGGGLLLVPQFTLAADTASGTRPSFSAAAAPQVGRRLFDYLLARARTQHPVVESGVFGAMMQVELVNDGPATFWLQVKPKERDDENLE